MKFVCHWLSAFFITCLAGQTFAGVKKLYPGSVLISGTLKPLTLAINGQKVLSTAQEETLIYINGQEVTSENKDAHRSVFYKTTDDHLEIKSAQKKVLIEMDLPSLKKLKSKDNTFVATVAPETAILKVDDEVIPADGADRIVSSDSNEKSAWFSDDHALTIIDPVSKVERVYVAEVSYDLPAQDLQRIGFDFSDSPISAIGLGVGTGFFYDRIFKNHLLIGGRVALPWPKSGFYDPDNGYILQVRAGYQFFRQSNAPKSPVWLEAGVGGQYVTWKEGVMGSPTPQSQNATVPFFFIHTIPLVIKGIQFGYTIQFGKRAADSIPNDVNTLMAIYEW
ncbi:hypothetical protein [Bdellovibrio sp. NC01]|uniref:hypothetical protein n=1 Tax=Bdellovibrio sp. NC01 TaxID=2220073 RepID=UPI00115B412A|nr:hypothetical protein [Bdellovibrio sp. NC01]QDK37215.1 hypothetical protein DOE51_06235 [Bdellovibrio sp. NC01]